MLVNAQIQFTEGSSTSHNLNLFHRHVINFKNVVGLEYGLKGVRPDVLKLEDIPAEKLEMRLNQIKEFAIDLHVAVGSVTMQTKL